MHPLPMLLTAGLLLTSSALAQDNSAKPLTAEQAREEHAYTVGVQAYVYGFPVVEMFRVRHARVFDPANKNRVPLNQFAHRRQLLDHTYKLVVSPNNDTLYSSAWLDLSSEPIVLHVPDSKGRYVSFQLMDFYTNNFAHVRADTVGKEGKAGIVGPGWRGTLPAGVARIDAPTNAVLVIARTLVDGKEDLPSVHALQDQYRLTTLSGRPARSSRPEPLPYDLSDPLNFFVMLNAGLRENPPPAREAALMSLFGKIGVGPDRTFHIEKLDPTTARGLRRAIEAGKQIIATADPGGLTLPGGWLLPPKEIGNYGDNYLLRAHVAMKGLGALSPEEAVYLVTTVDDQTRPLDGRYRYVLRLGKGDAPPVKAFWSLTMVRLPERLFVENPLGRYAIGDRTRGLQQGADGSVEIYLQHESPGKEKETNWLPAPKGLFDLTWRAYLPKGSYHDGAWRPPAVKRVE